MTNAIMPAINRSPQSFEEWLQINADAIDQEFTLKEPMKRETLALFDYGYRSIPTEEKSEPANDW